MRDLRLTGTPEPRDATYVCRVTGCQVEIRDSVAPRCPQHKIRLIEKRQH